METGIQATRIDKGKDDREKKKRKNKHQQKKRSIGDSTKLYYVLYLKHNRIQQVVRETFAKVPGRVITANKGNTIIRVFKDQDNKTRDELQKIIKSQFAAQSLGKMVGAIKNLYKILYKLSELNVQFYARIVTLLARLNALVVTKCSAIEFLALFSDLYCLSLDFTAQGMMEDLITSASSSFLPAKWMYFLKPFLGKKVLWNLVDWQSILATMVEWIIGIGDKMGSGNKMWISVKDKLQSLVPSVALQTLKTDMKTLLRESRDLQKFLTSEELMKQTTDLYNSCKVETNIGYSHLLDEMVRVGSSRKLWEDFTTLAKTCLQAKSVSRKEPLLLVFEGSPGCYKSRSMTKLIKTLGKSVYSHVVPSSKDTDKDFYDTYSNQEVFYMDDVGQMGIGQWRKMMNWVSCVPLPLTCASAHLKNTKFFTSSSILCTTNSYMTIETVYRDDCIADVSALHRRGVVVDFYKAEGQPDGTLRGSVSLKFYSMATRQFQRALPDKWKTTAHRKIWPDSLPLSYNCTLDFSWPDFIGWLRAIYLMLEKLKSEEFDSDALTSEDFEGIYASTAKYLAQSDPEDGATEDITDIVLSTLEEEDDIEFNAMSQYLHRQVDNYILSLSGSGSSRVEAMQERLQREKQRKDLYDTYSWVFIALETMRASWQTAAAWLENTKEILLSILLMVVTILFGFLIAWGIASMCLKCMTPEQVAMWKLKEDPTLLTTEEWGLLMNNNPWLCQMDLPVKKSVSSQEDSVARATGKCEVVWDDGTKIAVYGVRSGRHVIVPYHSVFQASQVTITLRLPSGVVYDKLPCQVDLTFPEHDLALLLIPDYNPVSAKVLPLGGTFANSLIIENKIVDVSKITVTEKYGTIYYNSAVCPSFRFKSEEQDRCVYNFQREGACGSPLLCSEGGIMGFHVSGNKANKIGFSSLWPPTVIEKMRARIQEKASGLRTCDKGHHLDGLNVDRVETNWRASSPGKSSLVKTELYDESLCTRVPSDLTKYGVGTVVEVGKKSMSDTGELSTEELNFCREVLVDICKPFDTLTDEEVINGNSVLAGLNKKSANGYNYPLKKKDYVNFETAEFRESFKQDVDEEWKELQAGRLTWEKWVWVESLKDEVRNVEKEGTPRSFRIGTIVNQVLTKRVFGKWVEQIQSSRRDNAIMIGMNPLKEWENMYKNIVAHPTFAGDIGSWDGKMIPQLQHLIVTELSKLSSEPLAAKMILGNMVNTPVVLLNKTVVTTHSMPSGSYLTAILNSVINRLYTAAWFKRYVGGSLSDFNMAVTDYVYGDDKVVVVHKFQEQLNALTMKEFFLSLGMAFTHSLDKTIQLDTPFQALTDITFLKRSFVLHPDLGVTCPLDLRTLNNTIMYCDSKKDYKTVMSGKLNSVWRELHLHPNYRCLTTDFVKKVEDVSVRWEKISAKALFEWALSFNTDFLIKTY